MIRLAFKSLLSRWGVALLTLSSIALAVTLLVAVERIREGAKDSFSSTVSGVDLLIGPRSGAVQLLLSSIFRIGDSPSAMSWESYQALSARPEVAQIIPLSLGDSHRGYRVLGTSEVYFDAYRYREDAALSLAQGRAFEGLYDVVLGASVAKELSYEIGENIFLNHGLGSLALAEHDTLPFTIAGILAPTGTPVDKTVHVSLEALEAIHVDWQTGAMTTGTATPAEVIAAMDLTPKVVSAALVQLKSPLSTFSMQRAINTYEPEPLSAVIPVMALLELWSVIEIVEQALRLVTALMLLSSLIAMSVTLLAIVSARRREIAILRVQGARPLHIVGFLVLEAATLGFLGASLGLALGNAGLWALTPWVEARFGLLPQFSPLGLADLGLIVLVTLACAVAGLLPAVMAYRTSLSDGIAVKS